MGIFGGGLSDLLGDFGNGKKRGPALKINPKWEKNNKNTKPFKTHLNFNETAITRKQGIVTFIKSIIVSLYSL